MRSPVGIITAIFFFQWMRLKRLRDLPKFAQSGGAVVRNLPANAGDAADVGSIPGSGRSPGEGNETSYQNLKIIVT